MEPQKHEFDQFAQGYRELQNQHLSISGETSEFFAEYKVKKMRDWLTVQYALQPLTILDFGCGDGMMTSYIQRYFPKSSIYGTDPSSESIAIAAQKYPAINFSSMINSLSQYKDNFFDLIVTAGVFHHIEFHEHKQYVQELSRVLSPHGKIIIFELNPLHPGTQYIFKNNPIDANAKMLMPWRTKKLFEPLGLIETKFYAFYPNLLSWLRPTEPYLEWVPFGALYACIVTTGAEKKDMNNR